MPHRLPIFVAALTYSILTLVNAAVAQQKVSFSRDVRPILSNACFHCHGPDSETREADLRFDQKSGLFEDRGDYVAVKPGDPQHSELIRRLMSDDPDEMMPPPDSNKTLTPEQKSILSQWIEQGAEWEQHWSFEAPIKARVPDVNNANWTRNEIDRFVLSRIKHAGLLPSPTADAHSLVRRVYLDLIGLPPSIEEADQWIAKLKSSADGNIDQVAWGKLVDHLLQSPQYGERWARRWLDLARYADTNGYEKDRERSIWPYRDWVVNAINDGMPFDRFTVEQLAGDMLPNASVAQRVATGFHRNTMLNEEGGIDPLEFRFHAMTDRVATTGTTWLGLTLGCCQCHTHKYDPVSHDEYFQLMAFLNNADEPQLELPDQSMQKTWQQNKQKAAVLLSELPAKWPTPDHLAVTTTQVSATADGGQKLVVQANGFTAVTGPNPEKSTYIIELDVQHTDFDQLQLSLKAWGKQKGPGRTPQGNCVLSEIKVEGISTDENRSAVSIPIQSAKAMVEQTGFDIARAFDGDTATGWALSGSDGVAKTADATFSLSTESLKLLSDGLVRLRVTLQQQHGKKHTIGAFRLTASKSVPADSQLAARQQAVADAYQAWRKAERPNAVAWEDLRPLAATSNLPVLTIQDDQSILATGDTAKRDDYEIHFAAIDQKMTSLRLEALPDERLPDRGPGSTYYEGTRGDFFLTEINASSAGGDNVFPFSAASETYAKNRFGSNPAMASLSIDGDIQTGWSVHGRQGERHVAVFNFAQPVPAGTELKIHMSFGRHFASSLGRFRFSSTAATSMPAARVYGADVVADLNGSDTRASNDSPAFRTFLLTAPQLSADAEKIRKLQTQPALTSTLVLAERPAEHPRPTFRHHRGEYLQPKNRVTATLPEVLLTANGKLPGDRLQFARWLVSEENPLTARVVVNRQWAAFFGTGIVKTVDDFGLQGESPSHPELLDWLAVTFQSDDNWSVKKLHRRIVTSATYQQSAAINQTALAKDPLNRLLCYSPRFRLDAEVVRDQLLQAAGVLNLQIGGPPVRPLQPVGITEVAYGGAKWNASSGADRYRRSLYTFIKRTAPFAMFSTFDAPSGEACIARRNRSNSPLQALTLLNDVMLMDLAQHAGVKATEIASESDAPTAVVHLFRSILVRPPGDDEQQELLQFFAIQRDRFSRQPAEAKQFLNTDDTSADSTQAAAWTAVARALFSLDESLTRS